MSAKKIGNSNAFRKAAIRALNILATPVKQTLGPDGLPILIQREGLPPLSTKDGVTVAESISVACPVHNTIIHAIKESAQKTNEYAGDGTTSAIVLTEAIVLESLKYIQANQITPQKVALELEYSAVEVVDYLNSISSKVVSNNEILAVASISANGEREVAEKVVEAIDWAGEDGVITLEDGWTRGITVRRIEGYRMGTGFSKHEVYGPKLIMDKERQESQLENANILLYDGVMSDWNELGKFLIDMANPRSSQPMLEPIVIVAHEYSGTVRDKVSEHVALAGLPIILAQTELLGTPNSKIHLLKDLAVLSGGKVISHGKLSSLVDKDTGEVDKSFLGKCQKIIQTKNDTTFFDGSGPVEDVEKHKKSIKKQISDHDSEFDKNLHRARIGKLVGGIIMVGVGGTTSLEMKERKDRVEDSLNATRAAILEGIVPGGGVALFGASTELFGGLNVDLNIGGRVLRDALRYPLRQIVTNTGISPDVVVDRVLNDEGVVGYDARKKEYSLDMIADGIIDPLRVVKAAFENALSIAIAILKGGGYCVLDTGPSSHGKMPDMIDSMQNAIGGMAGENSDDF